MIITPNFHVSEFTCHDLTPYPVGWIDARLRPLCVVLEAIRAELGGKPLSILSGYRSPAYNERIGGAKKSQHMEGRAADIIVRGTAPAVVHATVLRLRRDGKITVGGLGLYAGWVHVDTRPLAAGGALAQWSGTTIGSEVA